MLREKPSPQPEKIPVSSLNFGSLQSVGIINELSFPLVQSTTATTQYDVVKRERPGWSQNFQKIKDMFVFFSRDSFDILAFNVNVYANVGM